MTNEDAIKWLDNLKNDLGNPHYECLWPYAQALDEICELLKEQEALKPTISVDTWICSQCGHTLESQELIDDKENPQVLIHEQYNYCPNCGRAVKWDE